MDKCHALCETPAWKILNIAVLINLAVGVVGGTALQISENHNPAFREALRNLPVFGFLHANVMATLNYKLVSALAGMITSSTFLAWVLKQDDEKDRVKFGRTDRFIGEPSDEEC